MKIALIDPSLFTWPYDLKLAKGLTEIGHSVRVFGRHPDQDLLVEDRVFLETHFYPGFQARAIKRLSPGIQLGLKGLSHIESMARLVRRLRRDPPDVIHFQWTPLASIDQHFISSFKKIAPTLLTIHDSNPFNNNPRSQLQRIGALKIFQRFDHLLVHTSTARARVESSGISRERISIVAHGLLASAADIPAPAPRSENDPVRILLFGQIKPYKGVDILLRAIAQLPSKVRDACLVKIVGRPGMSMTQIFSLVNELKLKQHVEFDLRFIPDSEIPRLLSEADVQVFPYREIDASGVLMLAIAAGCPIVASKIGIFAEWLGDMGSRVLIEPDNPAELASSLIPLISDPNFRASASRKIANLRDSIPSWREIAFATEKIYQKARQ